MTPDQTPDHLLREHLTELLHGGFAPTVILLREFHYDKAGIVLNGLFYSAHSLLEHMRHRQHVLLQFMQDPEQHQQVWPRAHWAKTPKPESEQVWQEAIGAFQQDLNEIIRLVQDPDRPLLAVQANGKTLAWAAMTVLHHNGYHIGQIKAIGRQLGVW